MIYRLRGTEMGIISGVTPKEVADRIEKLEEALNKILQKCPYERNGKWCSCLDCNCVVARVALGESA